MPPMRLAVCFYGRIIIHDHIPAITLRALSPLPHYLYHNALTIRDTGYGYPLKFQKWNF